MGSRTTQMSYDGLQNQTKRAQLAKLFETCVPYWFCSGFRTLGLLRELEETQEVSREAPREPSRGYQIIKA